jgi:hypothetical protein
MTKKSPSSIEPNGTNHRVDGGDWTLTIRLEQRRALVGWVARDAAWPVATEIVADALNQIPSNARVHLDCRLPDSTAHRREK